MKRHTRAISTCNFVTLGNDTVKIYGCFTEGFDTADLKDAKVLLNDLNG
jgi:hypothetical protein